MANDNKGFFAGNKGWLIPTGIVALAAVGAFDPLRDAVLGAIANAGGQDVRAAAPVAASDVPAANTSAVLQDIAVTRAATEQAPLLNANAGQDGGFAAALDASVAASIADDAVAQAAMVPASAPEPVAAPRPTPAADPVAVFRAAAPAPVDADACLQDLRVMAGQTRIYFPAGGLTPDTGGLAQASIVAQLASSCPGVQIEVQGHSDPSGNPQANLALSRDRAEVVIARLGAMGANTDLFVPRGMGDQVPSGITGPQGDAFYDRRVEFAVITGAAANVGRPGFQARTDWATAPCVIALQESVRGESLSYLPRSITLSGDQLDRAMALARAAADCPGARLRVVGQFSDAAGSGEAPETARLRAKVLMTLLTSAGIPSDEIIMAAASESRARPGAPDTRVDFDLIVEEN